TFLRSTFSRRKAAGFHRSAEPGLARLRHTAGSACAQEEGGSWGKHGFPHAKELGFLLARPCTHRHWRDPSISINRSNGFDVSSTPRARVMAERGPPFPPTARGARASSPGSDSTT